MDEWESVKATLGVFVGNGAELWELLNEAASNPELALELVQNVRPDQRRVRFGGEMQRRLHRLHVASTKSLVDHTRRLVALYDSDSEFAREYERRKDDVASRPVTAFFNDLRNFILHRRLPSIGHRVTMSGPAAHDQKFESKVLLSARTLLEWDKWTAGSRVVHPKCCA